MCPQVQPQLPLRYGAHKAVENLLSNIGALEDMVDMQQVSWRLLQVKHYMLWSDNKDFNLPLQWHSMAVDMGIPIAVMEMVPQEVVLHILLQLLDNCPL